VLHMRLDYTNTRSHFYGTNKGRTYECEGARREPRHVPPPPMI